MAHTNGPDTLRGSSTSLPPISHLPVELLLDIISRLPDGFIPSRYTWPMTPRVVIPQVCRLWRDVARRCKELWTFIPLNSLTMTVLALERSHPLPIQILIHRDGGARLRAIRRALQEMSRVRELTWIHRERRESATDIFNEEVTAILSTHAAPALEALDLQFDDAFSLDPPDVPATLFFEDAPSSLRRLSIFGRRLPLSSTLLQAPLTSLNLNECNIWQTIDEAINTFLRLPHLEYFTAIGDAHPVLPVHSEVFLTPREPRSVELPRLKFFGVRAAIHQTVMLLRYLRLPPHCALHISSDGGHMTFDHGDRLRDLARVLSEHYEPALTAGEAFQTQVWRHRGDEMAALFLHALDLTSSPPPDTKQFLPIHNHEYSPILHIDIEWGVSVSRLGFDATQFLIHNMPILQDVNTLAIRRYQGRKFDIMRHFCSDSPSEWRSVFRDLQQVEILQIEENTARHFLRIFCEPPSQRFPHPLFPKLYAVTFSNVSFQDLLYEGTPAKPTWTLFQGLLNGLEPRLRSGVLKRVSIRECDLDEAMVETLRARWGKEVLDWDRATEGSEASMQN